ncbi:MAG TPA: ATPase [Clostridiales bacterium]|nr:ATPase [Clostridiales bacterium]
MKRNLEACLVAWKESFERKPLIIKGVRQCGKTYLLKKFGEKYYSDIAYFNFEETEKLKSTFENDLDAHRIISELSVFRGRKINPGTTLVIFDEIQFCSRAITSLKYFNENANEYHIVCAGSLLGIALSKAFSFPVGKVDFLSLYPMSFYEFLSAADEEMLCEYLANLKPEEKIPDLIHEKLVINLKKYYLIGGMPKVVDIWNKTRDIEMVEAEQQRILDGYELDFAKHAPIKEFPKLSAIWRSIPEQLSKENSKFIFGQVRRGWRAKDLEDALEWLVRAGLVYKVCKIEKPFMLLSSYADQTFFKLYLSDVGLLRRLSKTDPHVIFDATGTYREFKGAITENFVLCELVSSGSDVPYYWKSQNTAEVDFIIQVGPDILPIEVKSEKNDKAKSLAEYRKKYNPKAAVKTSMKPLSSDDQLRNIPLYLMWHMPNLL